MYVLYQENGDDQEDDEVEDDEDDREHDEHTGKASSGPSRLKLMTVLDHEAEDADVKEYDYNPNEGVYVKENCPDDGEK